jgi:NTE family protein
VALMLFFSGGGMRASALSYGVLQELAATPVPTPTGTRRMLDDVEMISSVSGGSFTAAYYALYHDRIFQDFERRFLKRDINGALISRMLTPTNWPRLLSPYYGRSDLAADYYDARLFDHATFGDLVRAGNRPFLLINATDMAKCEQFAFSQYRFDLIGSNLGTFPLARAVAASSAIPLLLTPITLQNHAGAAGNVESTLLPEPEDEALATTRTRVVRALMRSYTNVEERPFIHLVDGGLSDNLGLRSFMDASLVNGGVDGLFARVGMPTAHRLVLVIVNAAARRGGEWAKREAVPGIFRSIDQIGDNIGEQVNRHILDLFQAMLEDWRRQARLRIPQGAPQPDFYLVSVTFDDLQSAPEREYFQNLPTNLHLPAEAIDRLTEAGGRLLRESGEFRRLLRDIRADATPASQPSG